MVRIFIAEDDLDDQLLLQSAVEDLGVPSNLTFCNDGLELLEKVQAIDNEHLTETPNLIILDLNMPRKDGRETLVELKTHPTWKFIPVLILSTSDSQRDISFCYKNGANCFITKPASYSELVAILKSIHQFWFNTAKLPSTLIMPL